MRIGLLSSEDDHKQFWFLEERIRRLRAVYMAFNDMPERTDLSHKAVEIRVLALLRRFPEDTVWLRGVDVRQFVPAYSGLRRFIDTRPGYVNRTFFRTTRRLSGLLVYLAQQDTNLPNHSRRQIDEIWGEFKQNFPEQPPVNRAEPPDDIGVVFKTLSALIGGNGIDHSLAERVFFDPKRNGNGLNGRTENYYMTYRYASEGGDIACSFTRVIARHDASPVCRFSNHYEARSGDMRTTEGVILPAGSAIYMIGSINHGNAFKMIAVKKDGQSHKTYHEGLMVSFLGQLLASRVCFIQTDASHSSEVKTGRIKISDMPPEHQGLVEGLRNEIPFTLDRPVVNHEDQLVDAGTIVREVGQWISEGKNGKPLYRFADDENGIFNPADNIHYTFNSVLKLPDE